LGVFMLGVTLVAGCAQTAPPPPPAVAPVAEAPPAPPPAPASSVVPVSGHYAGVGTVTANPGGGCASRLRVHEFVVDGDRVRFGSFRGRVAPDGSLEMRAGGSVISGHFEGDVFRGRFWRPGPACGYALTLRRV
jgi:hypothetical protein